MRLGKEQAVGYVEDTEADSLPAQELTVGQADEMPLATAPEPSLTSS
jgi:hypothetical protein